MISQVDKYNNLRLPFNYIIMYDHSKTFKNMYFLNFPIRGQSRTAPEWYFVTDATGSKVV